jgi:hypothetical protein
MTWSPGTDCLVWPVTAAAWPFPPSSSTPAPGGLIIVIPGLLGVFAAAGVDAYTVATWLATGQDELDGRTPASVLGDPTAAGALMAAAERTASRLSH